MAGIKRGDTLATLGPRVKVGLLEELTDIDDGADYRRWKVRAQVMDSWSVPAVERYSRCSLRRGMSSTKLQGRVRMSSWCRRISSQPSLQAPGEPGRAKR